MSMFKINPLCTVLFRNIPRRQNFKQKFKKKLTVGKNIYSINNSTVNLIKYDFDSNEAIFQKEVFFFQLTKSKIQNSISLVFNLKTKSKYKSHFC